MRARTLLLAAVAVAALAFLASIGGIYLRNGAVAGAQPAAQAHQPGADHPAIPKRLEALIEIDMDEFAFATPDGLRNPTFTLPVGRTVGIHLHNHGKVAHELMIGRKLKTEDGVPHGYETNFFDDLETDIFFYYGEAKAELEGAHFEEIEVDPGITDVWLRLQVPPELAGEWEIGCFIPGHYEAGMRATLIAE